MGLKLTGRNERTRVSFVVSSSLNRATRVDSEWGELFFARRQKQSTTTCEARGQVVEPKLIITSLARGTWIGSKLTITGLARGTSTGPNVNTTCHAHAVRGRQAVQHVQEPLLAQQAVHERLLLYRFLGELRRAGEDVSYLGLQHEHGRGPQAAPDVWGHVQLQGQDLLPLVNDPDEASAPFSSHRFIIERRYAEAESAEGCARLWYQWSPRKLGVGMAPYLLKWNSCLCLLSTALLSNVVWKIMGKRGSAFPSAINLGQCLRTGWARTENLASVPGEVPMPPKYPLLRQGLLESLTDESTIAGEKSSFAMRLQIGTKVTNCGTLDRVKEYGVQRVTESTEYKVRSVTGTWKTCSTHLHGFRKGGSHAEPIENLGRETGMRYCQKVSSGRVSQKSDDHEYAQFLVPY
ncbi:hypothetical protein WN48_10435 [Eufriesea mexicana]|uniref:Uncharacterized protein n=1 Tax=Eufriesea mexicana TaxID=516756 RepID=A0A310SGN1_9HYME|nr:hypothetical protein WN48_10435 [Eufriesea mexicana]